MISYLEGFWGVIWTVYAARSARPASWTCPQLVAGPPLVEMAWAYSIPFSVAEVLQTRENRLE